MNLGYNDTIIIHTATGSLTVQQQSTTMIDLRLFLSYVQSTGMKMSLFVPISSLS